MLFGIFNRNPVFKMFRADGPSDLTVQKESKSDFSDLDLESQKPDPVNLNSMNLNSLPPAAEKPDPVNLNPVTLNLETGSTSLPPAADDTAQPGYLNLPADDSSAIRPETTAVLPPAPPAPVMSAEAPVTFSARLTGPKSASRKVPYKRATTNLLARKFKVVFSMLAASLIMTNQPVVNASLEEQKDQMNRFLGDVLDKEIENYSQCSDCQKRSRSCQDCRFHNSQRSLKEVEETERIWANMSVIQDPSHPNDKSRKAILIH